MAEENEQVIPNGMKGSRRSARIAMALAALGLVGAAIRLGLPLLVDREAIRLSIEKSFRQASGVNIQVHDLALEPTLFHGLSVHLNDNRITDLKHHPLGSIRRITVEIRYLPILFRQTPEIARVRIREVRIPITAYNLFRSLHIHIVKPRKTGFLYPPEMRNTTILLTDCRIEDVQPDPAVREMLFSRTERPRFRLTIDRLSIRHLESHRPVLASMEGLVAFLPQSLLHPDLRRGPIHYRLEAEADVKSSHPAPGKNPALTPAEGQSPAPLDARAIRRLNIELKGDPLALRAEYRNRHPDQDNATGSGSIQIPHANLAVIHLLALQGADTFGLVLPGLVPETWRRVYPSGIVSLPEARFQLGFPREGAPRLTMLDGLARLENGAIRFAEVSRSGGRQAGTTFPPIQAMNGRIRLSNREVALQKLDFRLGNLPLSAWGRYSFSSQRLEAILDGRNLPLNTLLSTVQGSKLHPTWKAGGITDIHASVAGPIHSPVYQGWVTVRQGMFEDRSQGLSLHRADARIHFEGTPELLRYGGRFRAAEGRLENQRQGVTIGRLSGDVVFDGRAPLRGGGRPPLPEVRGRIAFADGRYRHPQSRLPVERIHGALSFAGKQVRLEHSQGILGGAVLNANGEARLNDRQPERSLYHVRLWSRNIGLKRLYQEALAGLQGGADSLSRTLKPWRLETGLADLDVAVETGLRLKGRLDVHALSVRHTAATAPVRARTVSLRFNEQSAQLLPTALTYSDAELKLAGTFNKTGRYHFQAHSNEIPVSFLREQAGVIHSVSGADLPQIWNTAGNFTMQGDFSSAGQTAQIGFHDAGLSWKGADFPVSHINGGLLWRRTGREQPMISSRNLTLDYGNSPMAIQLDSHRGLTANAAGTLSPLLLNHFLVSPQSNATPYAPVPFRVQVATRPGNRTFNLLPQSGLKADVFLDLDRNLKEAEFLPADKQTQQQLKEERAAGMTDRPEEVLKAAIPPKVAAPAMAPPTQVLSQGPPQTPEAAWLRATLSWSPTAFQLENATLHLFDAGDVLANGSWSFSARRKQKPGYHLHVATSPVVDFKRLAAGSRKEGFFQGASGTVGMNVDLLMQGEDKTAQGWLKAEQLVMPYLTLRQLSGQATLNGTGGMIMVDRVEIPGVSGAGSGRIDSLFEVPITLEDVRIRGEQVSIAALGDFGENVVRPILVDQVAHSFARPWQKGDPTLPFQFRNADLQANEVIYQNIILTNLTGLFSVYANSFFELSDARLTAAGGVAHGYLSMSPNDNNFTTLELNMENVKANALTKALLNVTNQIFGDLKGTVRFSTFGETDEQMRRNANGTVSAQVVNGRLPAIARVETLLTTANVLRGGLLGLNLNNILRSLIFYDTNYFAKLSGDMLIGNEVLYTRNLLSDGVNLDLLIQGNLRMDNGRANMLVTGRMSQDVAGRLGFLGSLSLNRLLRYLPGIGTMGKNQPGLLGYLPGVGWVPGFGGPAGDVNWFRVRLEGALDDPSAVKSFHWIRPPAGLRTRSRFTPTGKPQR